MVTFFSGANTIIDFDLLDVNVLFSRNASQKDSAIYATSISSGYYHVFGGSFQYDTDGNLSGGNITYFRESFSSNLALSPRTIFEVEGVNVPVPLFLSWVSNHDNASAKSYIFSGNDRIFGDQNGDRLRGFGGSDTVSGSGGNDYLYGGDGSDNLSGGSGDDTVSGELGDDTIDGGSAGVAGNYLRGDEGDDSVIGGAGFDDINGNMGNDTCASGGGNDWVVGGKDNDSLTGSDGQNLVYGNIGADTCDGGAGNDIVRGGQDNDLVLGGAGNDFVSGDKGDDTMTGGSGADVFHTFGEAGIDRVTDFSLAQGDRVQLDPGTQFSVSQVGTDTVINMIGGGQMVLVGVVMNSLTGSWIFVG